jgi:UDP-N-acetylmuramoyl-L-alanyl-D-glutamate--2,6-diaminopimelate ligase
MDLLESVGARPLGPVDVAVSGVSYRSKAVQPGDAFFCVRGFSHDGHDFAAEAVSRGAVALVVQREIDGLAVPQFVVEDARAALAIAAARLFGTPSRNMRVVGITGTNGKTTTTYLLDAIARRAGFRTGVIGTVETRIADERMSSSRTTPESSDLQSLLAKMRDSKVDLVAMEVSSHAIDLHRVDAVEFAAVAFTNLTQDHLDYHRTFEEYYSVKRRLFTDFATGARVVDIDDPLGRRLAGEIGEVLTVGRSADADIRAEEERPSATGTSFMLVTPAGFAEVRLPLAGAFNVSNALVAAGCALSCGIGLEEIAAGLGGAQQVPGRLERIENGCGFAVVVDYAHTPDSLEKAIAALRAVTEERVIVVFGCGGDRDPDKRPIMGMAAAAADVVIVTSDNPRSEDPVGIILQIEDGLRGRPVTHEVEVDRRKAIARAMEIARPGDTVLLAGKGHEDYQIFADRTIHFDDREVAREELKARC